MNRLFKVVTLGFFAVAAAAGLGLVTSCNIAGSGGTGATGGLNLLLTDGPTDEWSQVVVILKSVSLRGNTWTEVWKADAADPAAGKINLVDLSTVVTILQKAAIPVGTYDKLRLVIDTDPATMTLVTDDGATIDPANVTVVDPSGRGEIAVDLEPAVTVEEGKDTNLLVDFDLAHPLSIVNLDGKVILSLKVRHKALPHRLQSIQFARTIGDITAAATDMTTFTVKTVQGAEIAFNVNANTIYVDADANAAGSFEGLRGLVGSGSALVASNMNADGSLYARRVWYAAEIDTLPRFTPEGLVRRVGDNWFTVMKKKTEALSTGDNRHRCDWNSETVFVDGATVWTFHDVAMGTGTGVLRHIARGFRVEVTFVDPAATPKVAATINVRSAHAEGLVTGATADGFTFGWSDRTRTMVYSAIADHTFGWWFYGLPSGRSTVVADFIEAVDQARAVPSVGLRLRRPHLGRGQHALGRRGPRSGPPAAARFQQDHDRLHGRERDDGRLDLRLLGPHDAGRPDRRPGHDGRPADRGRLVRVERPDQREDVHAAGPARRLGGPADAGRPDGQDLGAPGEDRLDLELARLQRDRLPVPPLISRKGPGLRKRQFSPGAAKTWSPTF